MTYIVVLDEKYTETTREPDTGDSWDRGDTYTDVYVKGIAVAKSTYYDIAVPFPVEKGKTYYLLWASYGTGDSFGRDDGMVDYIDLFVNRALAERAAERLREDHDSDPDNYSGSYVREGLTEVTISLPWVGYFEHLNSIKVTEVVCE